MDEFLAEDFEITRAGRMSKERRPAVTEQALRVAANVYREGFIEAVVAERLANSQTRLTSLTPSVRR